MQNKVKRKPGLLVISSALLFVCLFLFYISNHFENKVPDEMLENGKRVAMYGKKAYKISKENDDTVDSYVYASIIAQAYLQAKDE